MFQSTSTWFWITNVSISEYQVLFYWEHLCVKSARIQGFSGPQFPAFGLISVFSANAGKFEPEKLRI